VLAAVLIGNTGKSDETPIDTSKPAWVYHPPAAMKLTRADRDALLKLSVTFVQTAVARKQLDYAWKLIGPDMRAGQTRKSWDTGFNNVVPFKSAGIATWDVLYTYRDDVAFDLVLLGAKRQPWLSKTFTIELKRYAQPDHSKRWLVASWTPRGVGTENALRSSARTPAPPEKPPLSKWWLIVPAAIFAGMLSALALWGVLAALRGRRSARRYAQLLGQSSSSRPS
jgi:hypothetical protein